MLKIFIGYDERQPVSFSVLAQSIIAQSTQPVSIIPLKLNTLPLKRYGLTPFTYSRFLVPHLCGYEGTALFLDIDIILNGDISELFKMADSTKAVQVSKNTNKFEWASVMLFNCGHPANKILTPDYIEARESLHIISWCKPEEIGDLPKEWNYLVGYDPMRDHVKLVHYTQGIPAYPETIECDYSDLWHHWHQYSNYTQPWEKLMGNSIHAVQVNEKKMPKFLWDLETGKPRPEYEDQIKKILSAA